MVNRPGADGTDRLCRAVYGREARAADYLGGSEAQMLHDATDLITRLRAELLERAKLLDAVLGAALLYRCPTCGGGWDGHDACDDCGAWGGNGGDCDCGWYTTCPACVCGGSES